MGLSGAAYGAAQSLEQILAQKLLEKQRADALALQQQQLAMQQENSAADNARADEQLNLQRRQFDATQARQGQQDEIAATERRQVGNQQGVRRMIGDFLVQRGQQPLDAGARQTLQGMAIQEDVDLPNSITTDPAAEDARELNMHEQKRIIDLQHRPPSAASDDLVRVDTMENGKRVTKWLPKSQVAGRTFESPSGGPTLASGQQRRILNFYNRMQDSLGTVEGIEPEIAKQGLVGKLQGQYAPNIAQTPQQQSYRQAQRAFTEARLRKESGAAIPPHEYENDAKTYFAQPGDDEATIAQKRQKRKALLESTAFEAGPAYEEFYGEPFQRAAPPPAPTGGGFKILSVE